MLPECIKCGIFTNSDDFLCDNCRQSFIHGLKDLTFKERQDIHEWRPAEQKISNAQKFIEELEEFAEEQFKKD